MKSWQELDAWRRESLVRLQMQIDFHQGSNDCIEGEEMKQGLSLDYESGYKKQQIFKEWMGEFCGK